MRILFKLAVKLAMMAALVIVISGAVRYGTQRLTNGAAAPGGVQVSAEESGLISTVFGSALRLLSGSATREELAGDLSRKLYGERAEPEVMSELGIELVKPGGKPLELGEAAAKTASKPAVQPGNPAASPGEPLAQKAAGAGAPDRLTLVWERLKVCSVELAVVPVVFLGMVVWHRVRRRSQASDFLPLNVPMLDSFEAEAYTMRHAVHALGAEEFESLVALIYQRQGYRVSMPSGLSGGRGGDFTLRRKGESVLVQCKRLNVEHKVSVEKVRELHEAAEAAGVTRGMFVAPCGYSWDARNFAKTKGLTLINARTLDELIIAARANPTEDLLAVDTWLPGLMSKVEFTTPTCPACESLMDEVETSHTAVWVCRQRPDCKGRRCGRKFRKPRRNPFEKSAPPCEAA